MQTNQHTLAAFQKLLSRNHDEVQMHLEEVHISLRPQAYIAQPVPQYLWVSALLCS